MCEMSFLCLWLQRQDVKEAEKEELFSHTSCVVSRQKQLSNMCSILRIFQHLFNDLPVALNREHIITNLTCWKETEIKFHDLQSDACFFFLLQRKLLKLKYFHLNYIKPKRRLEWYSKHGFVFARNHGGIYLCRMIKRRIRYGHKNKIFIWAMVQIQNEESTQILKGICRSWGRTSSSS